ncbi:MAG: hypothetical protein OXB94_02930 [Nitrospira sp.]|nr:hypothetical protein [Nitrospira sp.]
MNHRPLRGLIVGLPLRYPDPEDLALDDHGWRCEADNAQLRFAHC